MQDCTRQADFITLKNNNIQMKIQPSTIATYILLLE